MQDLRSIHAIDTSKCYRMPWTMSDNGLSWLEPTRNCNLSCEYCYQRHDPQSHKSLSQIESELTGMMRIRKCDAMIIAGGEPLTHPQIIEITNMVKKHGTKPVVLTNGLSLTPSLVHKLKKAGVYGFIFHLTALDICKQIWNVNPNYTFSSYLGGTVLPDAPKWLFGTHVGSCNRVYGCLGARAAEILQVGYHFLAGRYLSFAHPKINSKARLLLPLIALDRGIRKMFKKRLNSFLRNPFLIFEKISIQNLIVMQPHDYLLNGEQDECDGCPNKTYWNGRLVSECRKEDYMLFGRPIITVKKEPGCARDSPNAK